MKNEDNELLKLASRFINQTGCNVFLTGKAGTGKTTFLHNIVKHTHKRALIAAPTGIAAINAAGVTLHSLFQLPFGSFVPERYPFTSMNHSLNIYDPQRLIKDLQMRDQKRSLLRHAELLIIDEVSMLRADILDAIDTVLRFVRRQQKLPFGGIQILFIGDLLQLPPVVKDNEWQVLKNYYPNMWFFNSKVLSDNQPLYLELEKVYRQTDENFIKLLNNIRNNAITTADIEILKSRYNKTFVPPKDEDYIHLTTHNNLAASINQKHLNELQTTPYTYEADISGDFPETAYPLEQKLLLKTGAQVMFIKNDPSGMKQFYNGRIGYISSLEDDDINVGFSDGSAEVKVEQYEWQNIRYTLNEENEIKENVLGVFRQYPIKLAWAVTIHKSQGLTFDKAVIDIGSAFAPGQIYVALSRLRSLDGLVLKSEMNTSLLSTDSAVRKYSELKEEKEVLNEIAEKESYIYFKEYLYKTYDLNTLYQSFKRHADTYYKDEALSAKQKYQQYAENIRDEVQSLTPIAEKFKLQLDYILRQPKDQALEVLKKRLAAANDYFIPLMQSIQSALYDLMKKIKENEKKVKIFFNELLSLESEVFERIKLMKKAAVLITLIADEKGFDKDDLKRILMDDLRKEKLIELQITTAKAKPSGAKKTEKGSSRKISLILFKEQRSVEEIAELRSLTTGTIESHLSYFVKNGELDAVDVIGHEKLCNIQSVMEKTGARSTADIKKHLGEEYTWGDIRIASAQFMVENQ